VEKRMLSMARSCPQVLSLIMMGVILLLPYVALSLKDKKLCATLQ